MNYDEKIKPLNLDILSFFDPYACKYTFKFSWSHIKKEERAERLLKLITKIGDKDKANVKDLMTLFWFFSVIGLWACFDCVDPVFLLLKVIKMHNW